MIVVLFYLSIDLNCSKCFNLLYMYGFDVILFTLLSSVCSVRANVVGYMYFIRIWTLGRVAKATTNGDSNK